MIQAVVAPGRDRQGLITLRILGFSKPAKPDDFIAAQKELQEHTITSGSVLPLSQLQEGFFQETPQNKRRRLLVSPSTSGVEQVVMSIRVV